MNHVMDTALLAQTPICGGLNAPAIELLTTGGRIIEVAAREYFFHESDPADAMYLLLEGRVAVTRYHKGKEFILAFLEKGDCFGEMALMDLHNRSASVRAEIPSTALVITPALLHDLYIKDVEQFTIIQMNLGREISRRLREADQVTFEQAVLTQQFVAGEFGINAI
ncbi:MAG: Crp/Fnr family transcriptional regulator [Gammaproteobacteria bacterium]|nr:Crp/Fnr family transcriptional regulator [Gammaproteobacteria bacterium]